MAAEPAGNPSNTSAAEQAPAAHIHHEAGDTFAGIVMDVPEKPRKHSRSGNAGLLVSSVAGLGLGLAAAALSLLRRGGKKNQKRIPATAAAITPKMAAVLAPDLSPFGSPVGGTPARMSKVNHGGTSQSTGTTTHSTPSKLNPAKRDGEEMKGDVSIKDQKNLLTDIADLQKQLALLQRVHEEDKRTQQFLEEYKAQTEVLKRLEDEREQQKQVIMRLESEIKDLKTRPAFPVTNGHELEIFKGLAAANSHLVAASVARSVCSDADHPGRDTSSVDNLNLSYSTRSWKRAMQELFQQGKARPSPAPSQPTTPRGSNRQQPSVPAPKQGEQRSEQLLTTLSAYIEGRMV